MNPFRDQLCSMIDDEVLTDIRFIGRSCYGDLGGGNRIRLDLKDSTTPRQYDALEASIFNDKVGIVDKQTLCFGEIFGDETHYAPYLYKAKDTLRWQSEYTISGECYESISATINHYAEMFVKPDQQMEQGGMVMQQ